FGLQKRRSLDCTLACVDRLAMTFAKTRRLSRMLKFRLRFSHPTFLLILFAVCAASAQTSNYTDDNPAVSPDGKKIVFMSDRDGDIEIYVMNVDGSHPQRLTHSRGRDA